MIVLSGETDKINGIEIANSEIINDYSHCYDKILDRKKGRTIPDRIRLRYAGMIAEKVCGFTKRPRSLLDEYALKQITTDKELLSQEEKETYKILKPYKEDLLFLTEQTYERFVIPCNTYSSIIRIEPEDVISLLSEITD